MIARNKKRLFYTLLAGVLLAGHAEVEAKEWPRNSVDTLAILSYNDFHGAFASDGIIPGAARLVRRMNEERARYPHSIVVSGGDNFSGSYFSKITRGEPSRALYRAMGVEMSAIGNHEFDWGLPYLADTAAQDVPLVCANLTYAHTDDYPEWLVPYRIVERQLKDGSTLRVAFVGLTTTEIYFKTKPENLRGLQFTNPLGAACVQTVYQLRKEGNIDLVILLMHIGTDMRTPYRIIEENAFGLPYIDGLDAIISAHSHERVLDKVNNVPIIQAGCTTTHIGKLLFRIQEFDGRRDISFIGADTIPVSGAEDPGMRDAVQAIMDKYHLSERLADAKELLIHDRYVNKFDYSPVGALVSSAYARCFRAHTQGYENQPVIGVNHYGGIRASLPAGEITRLRAGNVLPFGSPVVAYQFDGKRLKKLLEDGRHNPNGFLQSAHLRLQLKEGKIERIFWLQDKREIEIKEDTPCVVTLDSFITDGGDGYDASLFQGYEIEAFNRQRIITTEAFMDYLKGIKRPITAASTRMPIIQNR